MTTEELEENIKRVEKVGKRRNEAYSPKKVVGPLSLNFPRQPEPYETFSYGP